MQIKVVAHNQTWIVDYYKIEKLEWAPRIGRNSASGGEQVDWNMQLKTICIKIIKTKFSTKKKEIRKTFHSSYVNEFGV